MRHGFIFPIIIILSVAIGGLFYIYGGSAFTTPQNPFAQNPSDSSKSRPRSDFTVLAQGTDAQEINQKVNYRITSADEFTSLWEFLYGTNGVSAPEVNFDTHEVLAIFDSSHSTGGYSVRVNSVKDMDGKRVVDTTYIEPGSTCAPVTEGASPYVLISVKKTQLPLSREESTETRSCI